MTFPRHKQALQARPDTRFLRFYIRPVIAIRSRFGRYNWLRENLPAIHKECRGVFLLIGERLKALGFYARYNSWYSAMQTVADELGLSFHNDQSWEVLNLGRRMERDPAFSPTAE